jgi:hypothetical protein
VPLLDSKVVCWQSSLMMCLLLPMMNSSSSLPLLLVSMSCHIFDRALLSVVVNRPLPLAYYNVRDLFKKYPDCNCSGCSLGGMCLQSVLTCSCMS